MAILDDVELFSVKGDGSIKINFGDLHKIIAGMADIPPSAAKNIALQDLKQLIPMVTDFSAYPRQLAGTDGGSGVHVPLPTLGTGRHDVKQIVEVAQRRRPHSSQAERRLNVSINRKRNNGLTMSAREFNLRMVVQAIDRVTAPVRKMGRAMGDMSHRARLERLAAGLAAARNACRGSPTWRGVPARGCARSAPARL